MSILFSHKVFLFNCMKFLPYNLSVSYNWANKMNELLLLKRQVSCIHDVNLIIVQAIFLHYFRLIGVYLSSNSVWRKLAQMECEILCQHDIILKHMIWMSGILLYVSSDVVSYDFPDKSISEDNLRSISLKYATLSFSFFWLLIELQGTYCFSMG